MKTETYKTLLALDKAPPIMPAKRKAVAKDGAEAAIMTFKQVSELTGPTIKVLKKRKHDLPPFGFSHFLRYKKTDVMAFIRLSLDALRFLIKS